MHDDSHGTDRAGIPLKEEEEYGEEIIISLDMTSSEQTLHQACIEGDLEVVRSQLTKNNINSRDRKGLTPLYLAAYNGRVQTVRALLLEGAEVDKCSPRGVTPLHAAADNGWPTVLSTLLTHNTKPEVNAITRTGCTALYFACSLDATHLAETPGTGTDPPGKRDYSKCVHILLKSGADPNIAQEDGWRPLHAASCTATDAGIVRTLLTFGAEVDASLAEGATSLHLAAQEGKIQAIKHLLAAKSDINRQKDDGATALYMAAKQGHHACVKLLLKHGAKPDINLKGQNKGALHIAAENGHAQCVRLLLKHGADLNLSELRSPLVLARENGHTDICDLLENYDIEDNTGSTGCFSCVRSGKGRAGDGTSRPGTPSVYPGEENGGGPGKAGKDGGNGGIELGRPGEGRRRSTLGRKKCPYYEACKEFKQTLNLSDLYFDTSHDVCFCRDCHEGRGDNLYYTRGEPAKDYGLPIGWVKFGLKAPTKAFAQDAFKIWHVAFHGTKTDTVKKILQTGELLMPGDITPEGTELRPPSNHFDDRIPGNRPPPGHDINQIYLSPSIKYSSLEVYAPFYLWSHPKKGRLYRVKVAFQVRIKPHSYRVGPQTIGERRQIDPKFPNSTLEWATNRRGVTVLIGLLVQIYGPGVDGGEDIMRMGIKDSEPAITQVQGVFR